MEPIVINDIRINLSEVERIKFQLYCLEKAMNIEDVILEMILASIKETGPAEMSV